MMNTPLTYTIQEISEKTGLPTSTLRYYEEMGLLEPVWRLPLVPPSEASRKKIDAVLEQCGLLAIGDSVAAH